MKPLYHHSETVHNFSAAREVVPLIIQLINPKSVLDVGCGTGTWLKVFEDHGVNEYLGIDGEYVKSSLLKIPLNKFQPFDLRKPWNLNQKFDLVVSLEVAEHLPENTAEQFVECLIAHGDTILFSAAIPGQHGQHHINEQWPEYWQQKFKKFGFHFHDSVRPQIWNNDRIDFWYRQNIFILKKEMADLPFKTLSIVHPEMHMFNLRNRMEMEQSLLAGKQGLFISTKIFLKALQFKITSFFKLKFK